MKIPSFLFFSAMLLVSCNANNERIFPNTNPGDTGSIQKEQPVFFAVTNFIKGEIAALKSGGNNPVKFVSIKNYRDSSWIKMEDLDAEFRDFITPEIDSSSAVKLFSEQKFLDQTNNSVTLTYDPISNVPDSFSLKHWDVYIDPNSGKVSRIYIRKEFISNKIQQLTWRPGKGCSIVYISNDADNKPFVEKKVDYKWDF